MINGQTGADARGQLLSWPPAEPASLSPREESGSKREEEAEQKGEICRGTQEEGLNRGIDNKWLSVCPESTDEVI